MESARNYRDLIAWQQAMELVDLIYRLTRALPKEELYGLSNQMRRAAVSVPSNIAEGQGRRSRAEFHRFLAIAHGSVRELETQVMIARRQAYLSPEQESEALALASRTGRLIQGLLNKFSEPQAGPTAPAPPSAPCLPPSHRGRPSSRPSPR